MDLQGFLAEGPVQSLLVLMIVPMFAAILLIGFIVYSFSRRKKKSKMKLGIQPKKKTESTAMNSIPDTIPSGAGPSPADEVRIDILEQSKDQFSPSRAEGSSSVVDEPIDLSARLESAQPRPSPQSPPEEPAEMLRLLRQPQTGQLIVEIAGQRFTRLADITDRNIGQLVLQLAAHLLAFTNGNIFTQEGIKNLYPPRVDRLPPPPIGGPSIRRSAVSGSVGQLQPASAITTEVQASLQSEKIIPSYEPSGVSHRGSKSGLEQPSSPVVGASGLNLVNEINEIVKENLSRSPLAQTTRIEITSRLDGSLRIFVNDRSYAAPDDIPDEAVRALIKDSIKEWERR